MTLHNNHPVEHRSWLSELKHWVFNCPNQVIVARRAHAAQLKKVQVGREALELVTAIRRSHESQS
jgi:hypothetical protein